MNPHLPMKPHPLFRPHPIRLFVLALSLLVLLVSVVGVEAAAPGMDREVWQLERLPLAEGIAHYRFLIRVGSGEHDVLGIHRVVAEDAAWQPARTRDAVMMVHGGRRPFEPTFLDAGAEPTSATSPAVFLAARGIDVWGVDLRWALVPAGLTDYSFLNAWDLGTEIEDLGTALDVARTGRLIEGSGYRRIHLMGYSRGAGVAYAYVAREARRRPGLRRHVRSFTVGDFFVKTDESGPRQLACDQVASFRQRLDAGILFDDGTFFNMLGDRAALDPDGESLFTPQLTNRQLSLILGFDGAPDGVVPFFHFVAGGISDPFDTFLRYTPEARWIDLTRRGAEVLPIAGSLGIQEMVCDLDDVPWDDGLAEVTLPVHYLGAGGGIGEFGLYNLGLLGSDDVSIHLVELDEARPADFGHFDLLLAENAPELVWSPWLEWIRAH